MSYSRGYEKNTTTDTRVATKFFRDISVVDGTPSVNAPNKNTAADKAKLFYPTGAKSVEVTAWGDSSGNTATIGILSWPIAWGESVERPEIYRGVGKHILLGSFTFGGKTITPVHPIYGTVPAAGNMTMYEWSAYSSTFTDDNRVTEYPSGAGTSYQKRMIIDVQGDDVLMPYLTAFSTTTRVIIGLRVIE